MVPISNFNKDDNRIFDYDRALARFRSKVVLREAILAFLEESPALEGRLANHFHGSDFKSVGLMAHSIKGGLLMLEANRAAAAADALNRVAHRGEPETSQVRLEELQLALDELREALKQVLGDPEKLGQRIR